MKKTLGFSIFFLAAACPSSLKDESGCDQLEVRFVCPRPLLQPTSDHTKHAVWFTVLIL